MIITILDKLKVFFEAVSMARSFDQWNDRIRFLKNPIEAVRLLETAYLKAIYPRLGQPKNILDISSPYVASLLLARKFDCDITKTDINEGEEKIIKKLNIENIQFQKEDATSLSFDENHFDFTYSISVIEHIYKDYTKAIEEMIRVTRPGGHIYITTHCAPTEKEEWLDENIYSDQKVSGKNVFFQYRFSEKRFIEMLHQLKDVDIELLDIYPESSAGRYDRLVKALKKRHTNKLANDIKVLILNIYYGLFLFESRPAKDHKIHSLSNLHILLKVRQPDRIKEEPLGLQRT